MARTADDYLWLKLSFIKSRGNNETETFSYSDLQKMILEEYGNFIKNINLLQVCNVFERLNVTCIYFLIIGETHYHAYEKPVVYFQMLTLTGQFEPAIEFLSRIPRYIFDSNFYKVYWWNLLTLAKLPIFSRFQVHGVHMALALHDVYMLGTPRNVQAPLCKFDDLSRLYTRFFMS